MPLNVPVPTVQPPPVTPPALTPPPVAVTDAQMVAALEAEGYTVTLPSVKPVWGWFHGANQPSPVANGIVLDYADNNATSYSFSAARLAYTAGKRLMLKVGALTPAQATAIGTTLVANGQANAIIPIMWEGNQGVNGWESNWNENAMTAPAFVLLFNAICTSFRAVPGAKFTFAWCPNLNQVGNQKTGRTQTDTYPGSGVNGDIVIAPDGYDTQTDTNDAANIVAQLAPFEAIGNVVGLCETGLNNGSSTTPADDPKFWTDLFAHATAKNWQWIVNFALSPAEGGSFNSDNGPISIAAIQKFYAS